MSEDDETAARWDDGVAAALLGAHVLVGMTYVRDGATRQDQFFGTVVTAEKGKPIEIALGGTRAGEVVTLPPDTAVFQRAAPGQYRLRATGEVVVDPEFTASYTVHEGTAH